MNIKNLILLFLLLVITIVVNAQTFTAYGNLQSRTILGANDYNITVSNFNGGTRTYPNPNWETTDIDTGFVVWAGCVRFKITAITSTSPLVLRVSEQSSTTLFEGLDAYGSRIAILEEIKLSGNKSIAASLPVADGNAGIQAGLSPADFACIMSYYNNQLGLNINSEVVLGNKPTNPATYPVHIDTIGVIDTVYYNNGGTWIVDKASITQRKDVFSAANTLTWFNSQVASPDSIISVAILGDSKTNPFRGQARLRELLLEQYKDGGPGFGAFGTTPPHGIWFVAPGTGGYTVLEYTGDATSSVSGWAVQLPSSGNYYRLIPYTIYAPEYRKFSKLEFYTLNGVGRGAFDLIVDGTTITNINTTVGTGRTKHTYNLSTYDEHTIEFRSTGGGTVTLLDYVLSHPVPGSAVVHNLPHTGATSSEWRDIINTPFASLKDKNISVFIIRLGANDKADAGITADSFANSMRLLVAEIKTQLGSNVGIVLTGVEEMNTGVYPFKPYNDAARKIASDSLFGFVDLSKVFPNWDVATNLGLTTDATHENASGGNLVGAAYYGALMSPYNAYYPDTSGMSSVIPDPQWEEITATALRHQGEVIIGTTSSTSLGQLRIEEDVTKPYALYVSGDALISDTAYFGLNTNARFLSSGLIQGGFGSVVTTATTGDWNSNENWISGFGQNLLSGTSTNGPGFSGNFHPVNLTAGTRFGTSGTTQIAFPSFNAGAVARGIFLRGRTAGAGGSWSSWYRGVFVPTGTTDGQIPRYNATTGNWENYTLPTITDSEGIYSASDTLITGGTTIHSTLGRTGLTIDQDIASAAASSTTRPFRILGDQSASNKTIQYLTLKSPSDSLIVTNTNLTTSIVESGILNIQGEEVHLLPEAGSYDLRVGPTGLLASSAFEDSELRYSSGSNSSRVMIDNSNAADIRTTDGDGIAQVKTDANSATVNFTDASTSIRTVGADSTSIIIKTPTLDNAAIKVGQVPVTIDNQGHVKYSNALTTLDTVFVSTGADFSSTVFTNAFASGHNIVNLSAILNSGSSSSLQVLFPSASATNLGKRIHLKSTDNSGTHDVQISFTTGQLILQGNVIPGTLLTMSPNDYIELVSTYDGTNYYWQSQSITKSYRPYLDDKCYVQANVSLTTGIAPVAWRIPNYLVGKTITRISYSLLEAGSGTGDTSVRLNIGGSLSGGTLSGAVQYGLTAISPGSTFSELSLSGVPALVAGQLITIEVTGVSTTAPKGLSVSIEFQ